tara:strand:+ start:41 stop:565 length:525 start_codon:yes stop_codon:yes gene_type:complete
MRAINIFIFFIFLHGCASIEVAEVVTKTSIKVAEKVADAKTLISGSKETEDNNEEVAISQKQSEIIISEKKEEISKEKKKIKTASIKQKKISSYNFLGKSLNELSNEFGNPSLIREDGNTKTARFDTKSCRFFVYFNLTDNKKLVRYYEIRNMKGDIIDKNKKINNCYNEIKKT